MLARVTRECKNLFSLKRFLSWIIGAEIFHGYFNNFCQWFTAAVSVEHTSNNLLSIILDTFSPLRGSNVFIDLTWIARGSILPLNEILRRINNCPNKNVAFRLFESLSLVSHSCARNILCLKILGRVLREKIHNRKNLCSIKCINKSLLNKRCRWKN